MVNPRRASMTVVKAEAKIIGYPSFAIGKEVVPVYVKVFMKDAE
jgi:hypothetical protein